MGYSPGPPTVGNRPRRELLLSKYPALHNRHTPVPVESCVWPHPTLAWICSGCLERCDPPLGTPPGPGGCSPAPGIRTERIHK